MAWIERIIISTQPAVDAATLRQREDALGELQLMLESAAEDDELRERLNADIGKLASMLPPELGADSDDPALGAAAAGDYGELIAATRGYLLARLTEQDP